MFDSSVRSAGDLAGVFECDGGTCYFYLYDVSGSPNQKIVDAIRILSGRPHFNESGVAVAWDANEGKVGLFIRGQLWALLDQWTGKNYGGGYQPGHLPEIPAEASRGFSPDDS